MFSPFLKGVLKKKKICGDIKDTTFQNKGIRKLLRNKTFENCNFIICLIILD